ncbi:MAG: hypothetical protein GYA33_04250 [Thermogutta sp.]|nr:hypothetical protein [Thermogutta sp.]
MNPYIVVTIVVGDVLLAAGLLAFFLTGASHVTALIPAAFGLLIQTLGVLCLMLRDYERPLMTAALILAVLGLAAGVSRPIMKLAAGESLAWNAATISQAVMGLGCAAAIVAAAMFLLTPPGKP